MSKVGNENGEALEMCSAVNLAFVPVGERCVRASPGSIHLAHSQLWDHRDEAEEHRYNQNTYHGGSH